MRKSKQSKSKSHRLRDDNSSDSEQSEDEQPEQDKKKRVAVNDLFTPDTVAQIVTPVSSSAKRESALEARMEQAVQLETIQQNEAFPSEDGREMSGDAIA